MTLTSKCLEFNKPGNAYVCCRRPVDIYSSDQIPAVLKFTYKDSDSMDPEYDEGIQDDYTLEDIRINVTDFMQQKSISLTNFKTK